MKATAKRRCLWSVMMRNDKIIMRAIMNVKNVFNCTYILFIWIIMTLSILFCIKQLLFLSNFLYPPLICFYDLSYNFFYADDNKLFCFYFGNCQQNFNNFRLHIYKSLCVTHINKWHKYFDKQITLQIMTYTKQV